MPLNDGDGQEVSAVELEDLPNRLQGILLDLDNAGLAVAAAHVQMAIDLLGNV